MEELKVQIDNKEIKNGEVVVFKVSKIEEFTDEFVHNLQLYFASKGLGDCIILIVNSEEEIKTLNEEQMERLGWVRKK